MGMQRKGITKVTVFLEGETGGMVYENVQAVRPMENYLVVQVDDRDNCFNRRFLRCYVIEYAKEPVQ